MTIKTSLVILLLSVTSSIYGQTKLEKQTNIDKLPLTSFEEWFQNPYPIISAHRGGGAYFGYPENAIESFDFIINQIPAIIECDVSMTKDSVLVLLHDNSLERTTSMNGKLVEYTYEEIKDAQLIGSFNDTTNFHIPRLVDVLHWGRNKAVFTLDIKRGVPFKKVIQLLESFDAFDYAAVITYSINDAIEVYKQNSRAYLSMSIRDKEAMNQFKKSGIPAENVFAFVGTREPELDHYSALRMLGIPGILGTLGNLDRAAVANNDDRVYTSYITNGALIIATDRPIEVAKVLYD